MTNAAEVIKEAVPGTHVVWAHILDDVAGERFEVRLLATNSPHIEAEEDTYK